MSKKKVVQKEELKEVTVRQFFYINEVMNKEPLIKTLERTYKDSKKSLGEWEEVMVFKNIIL